MNPKLTALQDRTLGPFSLHIQYQPRRRVGHFDLDIFLKDREGKLSCDPSVTGIYSKGNPSNKVFSWFDIHYLDRFAFDNDNAKVPSNLPWRTRSPRTTKIDNPHSPPFRKPKVTRWSGGMGGFETYFLSDMEGLAEGLFEMLGNCTPPGGMIICSYITDVAWAIESPLHEVTRRCMALNSLGIPPAATPLGRLLVAAGFCNIKSGAYDVQGSSRLAGEKALDKEYEERFRQGLIKQLEEYVGRDPHPEYQHIEDICRTNAGEILGQMSMK